ncbi:MAG: hypothetical protein CMN74_11835 [Sphingorhabdus sp.]|nr:hypothetical protein [Sphingorhabdus sp.]
MLRRVGLVEGPTVAVEALEGHHVQHDFFLRRRLRLVRQVFAGNIEDVEVLEGDPALLQVRPMLKGDMPFPAPTCLFALGVLLDGTSLRNHHAHKFDVRRVNGETRRSTLEANRLRLSFPGHRVLRRSSVTTISGQLSVAVVTTREELGRHSAGLCHRILYLFVKMRKTWLAGR